MDCPVRWICFRELFALAAPDLSDRRIRYCHVRIAPSTAEIKSNLRLVSVMMPSRTLAKCVNFVTLLCLPLVIAAVLLGEEGRWANCVPLTRPWYGHSTDQLALSTVILLDCGFETREAALFESNRLSLTD